MECLGWTLAEQELAKGMWTGVSPQRECHLLLQGPLFPVGKAGESPEVFCF